MISEQYDIDQDGNLWPMDGLEILFQDRYIFFKGRVIPYTKAQLQRARIPDITRFFPKTKEK